MRHASFRKYSHSYFVDNSEAAEVKRRTIKEYIWETILEIHEVEFNINTVLGWLTYIAAVKNWFLEEEAQFERFRES